MFLELVDSYRCPELSQIETLAHWVLAGQICEENRTSWAENHWAKHIYLEDQRQIWIVQGTKLNGPHQD